MESSDVVVIFSTLPATESEAMSRALIESRLVACVNVVPVHSYYRWNGNICSELEHLLIAKTKKTMAEVVIAIIKGLHSYEVPEILALPVIAGYAPYLSWVHDETDNNDA